MGKGEVVEHDTATVAASPTGVFSSIKNFAASFVAHMHTRLQLFATEFAEEKLRLTSLLFSALTALFLFFAAIIFAAFFVVAASWDTPYRLHAVGALTLLFFAGAGIFWSMARTKLKSKPRLFEASLAELYKDRQELTQNDSE